MAVTQNTYTGDGTTVLFSFTFPYLETTDIKVSLNGTVTTAYTLANATTVQFNTAPANGAAIRIYRQTDDSALAATFYPGSAIRSNDLNENFTQNLYVTQESSNNAATATSTANTALTNSNTAISTANSAVSTANTASSNASAAVSTANTASSNASAAVSTANTASSNATTAVNTANAATATANSATSTANTALSTANAATSTANTASTAATNAVNTANAASSAASSAVSTANTASTNASNAVTTANTASTNATTAVNTANTAVTTANAAAAAVANAVLYTTVANVAAIPASPANNTAIEVTNSTGIESFTPLSGKPAGFIGSSGLSVRIIYQTTGSTWIWIQYFPNDPEARYLKLAGGTVTGNLAVNGTLTKSGNNVVTVGDTGTVTSTMIADGTIVNADINASAAIAGTKISPDFGSQNVTTTGTSTAASFIPSSSTVPTNGLYLPSANSVAISTNGTGRLFVDASGNVGVGVSPSNYAGYNNLVQNGSSGSTFEQRIAGALVGSLTTAGDVSLRSVTAIPLTLHTNNTERLRITSAGLVGVGTSLPSEALTVAGNIRANNTNAAIGAYGANSSSPQLVLGNSAGTIHYSIYETIDGSGNRGNLNIFDNIGSANRLTIDTSGRVGIGNTPSYLLDVNGDTAVGIGAANSNNYAFRVRAGTTGLSRFIAADTSDAGYIDYDHNADSWIVRTNGSEAFRVDSSRRLLVGTSSSSASAAAVLQGFAGSSTGQGILQLQVGKNTAATAANEILGSLRFANSDGNIGAWIAGETDLQWNSGDYPSRLVFSTAADGASSPTERARLNNLGYLTGTVNGLGNGLYLANQFYRLNSGNIGSNATGAQSVFGVGVSLVADTVYAFESFYVLQKSAGTTSHTVAVSFGGTAGLNNINYGIIWNRDNTTATSSNMTGIAGAYQSFATSASSLVLTTAIASSGQTITLKLSGTVSISTAGTFIPQYTLSAAPGGAYTTLTGSYFKIAALGAAGANTSIGSWA